jgi:hypothetical protein
MRKITSLTLGFAFLIMTYTGIMLFIAPQGKIAHWSNWELLGLSKTQYGDIHITSMFVMIIFGIWHIYYNWKAIVSYLKDKTKKISFTKQEFVIALSINIIFIFGTLNLTQPFQAILDLNDGAKKYWVEVYGQPPFGHAEDVTLKKLCKRMDIEYEEAIETLKKNKIIFSETQSMKEIATANNMSPAQIYKLIEF